jgi:hypothetical protein
MWHFLTSLISPENHRMSYISVRREYLTLQSFKGIYTYFCGCTQRVTQFKPECIIYTIKAERVETILTQWETYTSLTKYPPVSSRPLTKGKILLHIYTILYYKGRKSWKQFSPKGKHTHLSQRTHLSARDVSQKERFRKTKIFALSKMFLPQRLFSHPARPYLPSGTHSRESWLVCFFSHRAQSQMLWPFYFLDFPFHLNAFLTKALLVYFFPWFPG